MNLSEPIRHHISSLPPHARVYQSLMGECERILLTHAMRRTGGNQSEAARYLRMNRNTLMKKLKQHQIKVNA